MISGAIESIIIMIVMYALLITEKFDKVVVVGSCAMLLVILQVFSQDQAFSYISNNLGMLGFIVGMTIVVSFVKDSGIFDYIALRIVKLTKGNRFGLLLGIALLTWVMTIFLPNIPTVLILTPILIILVRQLNLPAFPYFLLMLTITNIAGATTPISDPTTYYLSQKVGLGFLEVVRNSGMIVSVLIIFAIIYIVLLFYKQLSSVSVSQKYIDNLNPTDMIIDKQMAKIGLPLLFLTILSFVLKDFVADKRGVYYQDAVISLSVALGFIIWKKTPMEYITKNIIDWDIIFFFMGLFVVIGGLEHTGVITQLGQKLLDYSNGNMKYLLLYITMGSGVLSTFIDNVPYNITMISAIQSIAKTGIEVYPLRWALNLATSFGGAGSPIGAACSVVSLGEANKDHIHFSFLTYMKYAFPLVILNGIITFILLYRKFLM